MTLTETVFWTKIFGKYVVGGFILITIGYFVYGFIFTKNVYKIISPDYKCGVVVAPKFFPQEGVKMENAEIQVKALKAALPDREVPKIAYVFKIDIKGETFKTRDKAMKLAEDLDFVSDAYTHEPGNPAYEWNRLSNKSTLKYNTATDNFTFYKDVSQIPKAPNIELPTLFKAENFATNYLKALGLYTSEFIEGKVYPYTITMREGISAFL